MIVSFIKNANYSYFSLHAEEVFASNFIRSNNEGINVSSLQSETLTRLSKFITENPELFIDIKYIILDFKYIHHTQANIIDKIAELKKSTDFKLIFKNVSIEIIQSLALNVIRNSYNVKNKNDGYDIFYYFEDESDSIYGKELNGKIIFQEEFERKIENYILAYNKRHTSSFVYLTSFVDIKSFICKEKEFSYFALYKLAMQLKFKFKKILDEKPILVCQNLVSTYMISVLSNLLNLDILIFDKIGPINKLYNKLEKHNFNDRKYIVVSDFVCLGTEVKIVKNLIEFSGGKYLGNVSMVKVETLSRDDIKLDNIDRTISVFSINKENNERLNYFIYTDLKPKNE